MTVERMGKMADATWQVVQVFNNNVLLAQRISANEAPNHAGHAAHFAGVLESDASADQAVLLGRGIGFQKRRGDLIDAAAVHRYFVPETSQAPEELARLVADIDPSQLVLAQELAGLATTMCQVHLTDSAVVALADHVRFAVERAIKGQDLPMPLQWEVQHLYPQEYAFGQAACRHIREATGVQIADSEAVSLALHVVQAQLEAGSQNFERVATLTTLLTKILDTLDAALPGGPGVLDRDSMAVARFITHLKFLLQRLLSGQREQERNLSSLQAAVASEYPQAYGIAKRVVLVVQFETDCECSANEVTYLALHIARLMQQSEAT